MGFSLPSRPIQLTVRFDVPFKTRSTSTSAGAQVAIGSQSLSVFVVYCNDMRAPQPTMVEAKIVDPFRSGELWGPDALMRSRWNRCTALTRNHYGV